MSVQIELASSGFELTAQGLKTYNDFMPQDRQRLTISLFLALAPACLFLVISSLLAGSVSAQSAPGAAPEGAPSSFSLIGTIKGGPFGGAVLQDASGKQTFYQLREKLPDGSQIVHLREDSISLKSEDGTVYDMYIAHDTKRTVRAESSSGYNAPESASIYHKITPAQQERIQERINRNNQRMQERARRMNDE
jgi:hypothetical protein